MRTVRALHATTKNYLADLLEGVSCCDGSLLECLPAVQEVGGSNPRQYMSVSSALPYEKDGDDLGQVSPK